MIDQEIYQHNFCQKFTPWLQERWTDNEFFRTWVDLAAFLEEKNHGLVHSAKVRATTYKIAKEYLDPKVEFVDEDALDLMALFHDVARHVRYPVDRENPTVNKQGLTKKEQRIKRAIFPHELTGAAIARVVSINDAHFKELINRKGMIIFRHLLSHDYHSPEVTPYCRPPRSLEAQVLCVADKTSIDPLKEVSRRYKYLTTRPGRPVPFLDPTFPLQSRKEWNFQQDVKDALCGIVPIFSFYPHFTSSEGLRRYYDDWSTSLDQAVEEVLFIASTQGGDQMKNDVRNILHAFNIR